MPSEKMNFEILSQRVDTLEKVKANQEYVISEVSHLKESLDDVKEKVDEGHRCSNTGLLENVQAQVRDNSQSIKKIYTWQATVGISLLVFFLTMGVAALRFVDKIDYAVQTHSEKLEKIESVLDEKNDAHSDLKEYILKLLKDKE